MTRKQLSENLNEITTEILQNKISNISTINMTLYSVTNIEFKLTVLDVQSLIIDQDFIKRYTDFITIKFSLSTKEYIDVINNYRDLKCSIIIENYIEEDKSLKQQDPIIFDQKIIFQSKDDLFKTVHKSEIVVDNSINQTESHISKRINIVGQLIDDNVFEIRKKQFNLVCRDSNIETLLHFIVCNMIEPKYKCIMKPDNDTVYDNIVIPGLIPFEEVFGYLNKKYGIYDKGVGFYYTEDTMFIYPLYNFNPEISPYLVNIYFVGSNNILGANNYLLYKNDCYHILTNREPKSSQFMEQGTENFGNGYMVLKDSLLFNKWREQEQEDFKIIKDGILQMQLDNNNTLSEFSHNLRYVYGEENIDDCITSLSSINGNVTVVGWDNAKPFIIKPGWKILYHYDGEKEYNIKSGSCLNAKYVYNFIQRKGQDKLFSCTAGLTLFTE